jgi:hypothetical protein
LPGVRSGSGPRGLLSSLLWQFFNGFTMVETAVINPPVMPVLGSSNSLTNLHPQTNAESDFRTSPAWTGSFNVIACFLEHKSLHLPSPDSAQSTCGQSAVSSRTSRVPRILLITVGPSSESGLPPLPFECYQDQTELVIHSLDSPSLFLLFFQEGRSPCPRPPGLPLIAFAAASECRHFLNRPVYLHHQS